MFFNKEYIAELLYDTLLRNNGRLFVDLTRELMEFRDETGLEIKSHEDLDAIQEALEFLSEHNVVKSDFRNLIIQAVLVKNPPLLDDWGIYPWDKKTNLWARLSPKVLRELYSLDFDSDKED